MSNMLRNLPSVNDLLESPPLKSLVRRVNQNILVSRVRLFLDDLRTQVQTTAAGMNVPTPAELAQRIAEWIAAEQQPEVRPVINATGILLHPELGGPPLAAEAIAAAATAAGAYVNMELDLASGERTCRSAPAVRLLERLTGAEGAAVVNSHAGAGLLALAALAQGREVLVSRGELVEIPGSHRIPEVIAASGAVLREVGTTNSTRILDYAAAIGERTAAVLQVSAGGNTVRAAESPGLVELAALARQHNLPLIHDLGSGSIVEMSRYGIPGEPVAAESLKAGADLAIFSGDRLLGGPQCGLIVGRRSLIEQLTRHPLMAALRVDKLSLAALIATLRLYQEASFADRSVPLLSLLSTPLENLRNRAQRLAPQVAASGVVRVEVVERASNIGIGALKSHIMASVCLSLEPLQGSVRALDAALRTGLTAVVGQTEGDRLLLDLRTVLPRQDIELVAAFEALSAASGSPEAPLKDIPNLD